MDTVFVYSVCIIASSREVARGERIDRRQSSESVSYECAPHVADIFLECLTARHGGAARPGDRLLGGQCRPQLVEWLAVTLGSAFDVALRDGSAARIRDAQPACQR